MSRPREPQQPEIAVTHANIRDDWQRLLQQGLSRQALTAFHARYKYLLMAHNPWQYKALGKLLGTMDRTDAAQLGPYYFSQLMAALERRATRGTHVNVLLHLSGYLRQAICAEDKREVHESIEQYHQGKVPLTAPIALLQHHFNLHPDPYVQQQVYLQSHPQDPSLCDAT